jgi:hypothetical protein
MIWSRYATVVTVTASTAVMGSNLTRKVRQKCPSPYLKGLLQEGTKDFTLKRYTKEHNNI